LTAGDVLFIDEIHRISKKVQEALYTVMEDFRLDIPKEDAMSIDFAPFTIIGATTEVGLLLRPFYDRFIHKLTLEDYSINELSQIISANCKKLNITATDDAIRIIAKCSRYTPRVANGILQFTRDFAYTRNSGSKCVDNSVVINALKLQKIDGRGLDSSDRKYIMVLRRAGKSLGLKTIAASTGMSLETIENQIEPYLLKLGMIEKSSKGRILCK
jgi:Holliday junction DNA helicase RuvB